MHPYRRGAFKAFRGKLRRDARDDGHGRGLWHGVQGFRGGQLCARLFRRRRRRRGRAERRNRSALLQSDDITGEALGFAEEALFAAGALDVFTLPIQMKKSRPGVLLCCICEESAADKLAAAMLSHTSTFGVRKSICPRYMLSRSFSEVQTRYGTVRIKTGTGYGVEKASRNTRISPASPGSKTFRWAK